MPRRAGARRSAKKSKKRIYGLSAPLQVRPTTKVVNTNVPLAPQSLEQIPRIFAPVAAPQGRTKNPRKSSNPRQWMSTPSVALPPEPSIVTQLFSNARGRPADTGKTPLINRMFGRSSAAPIADVSDPSDAIAEEPIVEPLPKRKRQSKAEKEAEITEAKRMYASLKTTLAARYHPFFDKMTTIMAKIIRKRDHPTDEQAKQRSKLWQEALETWRSVKPSRRRGVRNNMVCVPRKGTTEYKNVRRLFDLLCDEEGLSRDQEAT